MVRLPERSAVRRAGRAARQAVVGEDRVEREASLMTQLASVHALQAASVGVFVAHDGEPDITPFVELLWSRGQQVALPVLEDDPNDRSMQFQTWTADMALATGRYGIPVPPPSPIITPRCLLVSLTAFDSDGNRMGRGAGFFDRYLAATDCGIVGVGFETQRIDAVPIEPHDVAMPTLVTDLGVRYLS